jgi:hypothetical protein
VDGEGIGVAGIAVRRATDVGDQPVVVVDRFGASNYAKGG